MDSWLMVVNRVGRHTRSRSYIQGSTHNHENDGKTNNLLLGVQPSSGNDTSVDWLAGT